MDIKFPNPPGSNKEEENKPLSGTVENTNHSRFGRLINNNGGVPIYAPVVPAGNNNSTAVTTTKSTSVEKKKSSSKSESKKVSSKDIVENTQYSEIYSDTNAMAYGIIQQADTLLSDAKMELDNIRSSRTMKGKYLYMNNTLSSMASLMSTKLQAIREINNNIKNANDLEYRRYKDNRALDNTDDTKAVMDAYKAFISAPIGAPAYRQPNTMEITAGLNGIVYADRPAAEQMNDAGYNNYMNTLTPEKNFMLHDNNPDIEEVIIVDQATGARRFQWMNTKTNTPIDNMPLDDPMLLEDYTIDSRTKLARNMNMNTTKKVIFVNEDKFDQY